MTVVNQYTTEGEVTRIETGKGDVILFDTADLAIVSRHHWRGSPGGGTRYAKTHVRDEEGKGRNLYLHRLVMGASPGEVVDHLNGNGLDNRRENLRLCTHRENIFRQKRRCTSKGTYRGVTLSSAGDGKWQAQIGVKGRNLYLGRYDTEREAAVAYNRKAIEVYGDSAVLNDV